MRVFRPIFSRSDQINMEKLNRFDTIYGKMKPCWASRCKIEDMEACRTFAVRKGDSMKENHLRGVRMKPLLMIYFCSQAPLTVLLRSARKLAVVKQMLK